MFISLDYLRETVEGVVHQRCDISNFTLSNVFDCAITCLQLYGISRCLAVHFNQSEDCALCVTDEDGCASQILALDGENDVELIPSSLPSNWMCFLYLTGSSCSLLLSASFYLNDSHILPTPLFLSSNLSFLSFLSPSLTLDQRSSSFLLHSVCSSFSLTG